MPFLASLRRRRPQAAAPVDRPTQCHGAAASARDAPSLDDPCWAGCRWTVYRGVAYDLKDFSARHPGGSALINLAVGRDCTALVESNHLRWEVVAPVFSKLPVLQGFPVHAVPRSPRPNDDELYTALHARVRAEVFRGGESRGTHRSGTLAISAAVVAVWALSYVLYLSSPSILAGTFHGLVCAWAGFALYHSGNHGMLSPTPWVNDFLSLCGDLATASSLRWRYIHQVSHHVHTNDHEADTDVFATHPILRRDPRLPARWWHRWQHIYVWALFPLLWFSFTIKDLRLLFADHIPGVGTLAGATRRERAGMLAAKLVQLALLLGLPCWLHGAAALVGAVASRLAASVLIATLFMVSHDTPSNKPLGSGPAAEVLCGQGSAERAWALQQVVSSCNWGGAPACLLLGGLNLHAGHHLFPSVSYRHMPAITAIIADECRKRGIPYTHYPTFFSALVDSVRFLRDAGAAPNAPDQRAARPLQS